MACLNLLKFELHLQLLECKHGIHEITLFYFEICAERIKIQLLRATWLVFLSFSL